MLEVCRHKHSERERERSYTKEWRQ
uniref:Uncharacterized protein n=1 Tax=Arundo donax TaxID=35708 RepID=A0A0A9ADH6_ARUDO